MTAAATSTSARSRWLGSDSVGCSPHVCPSLPLLLPRPPTGDARSPPLCGSGARPPPLLYGCVWFSPLRRELRVGSGRRDDGSSTVDLAVDLATSATTTTTVTATMTAGHRASNPLPSTTWQPQRGLRQVAVHQDPS